MASDASVQQSVRRHGAHHPPRMSFPPPVLALGITGVRCFDLI
jgi:hypothetical protein